jgi:metal-responsive CopG/Arc/MetJ family transcriptional regulator
MNESKTVAIRVELPDDLRNQFKSAVAREGKNMRDVLLEFIERYVKEKEQPPSPTQGEGG